MSGAGSPRQPAAWLRTRPGRLALALLAIEFLAGVQSVMQAAVAPEIAAEFHAERSLGAIHSAALASSFLGLPWGPRILQRLGPGRTVLWATVLSAAGALLSAATPDVPVFLLGRCAAGLSAGILATASMSAVVQHLPAGWRRAVFAGFSAVSLVSSLAGPAYAAAVAQLLHWRWAMVLYLPLLLAARAVVARNLGAQTPARDAPAPGPGLALALPVSALAICLGPELPSVWGPASALAGASGLFVCAVRLLPRGVFRARRGRRCAVRVLFVLTGLYVAVEAVIPISARAVLHVSLGELGAVLAAGGLAWATVGVACARRPALRRCRYRRRTRAGGACLLAGFALVAGAVLWRPPGAALALGLGWTLASIGMGLVYLDTVNLVVAEPEGGDGMDEAETVRALAYSEQLSALLFATPFASLAGALVSGGAGGWIGLPLWGLAAFSGVLLLWTPAAASALRR